ncbi:MAG: YicC/YloC family endoribonuclease [Verrucomicrobiales bacterium]
MNSMTGFGRGELVSGGWRYGVEMSSVNRKQSEIVINLPRVWQELEGKLRQLIAERISRGRVQVSVTVERAGGSAASVRFDAELARGYLAALKKIERLLKRPVDIEATDLLRAPGVFAVEEIELGAPDVWPQVERTARKALEVLSKARRVEGAALKADLQHRLDALAGIRARIEKLAAGLVSRYRETLHRRLIDAGLTLALEDDRLLKEVALFAERCDISEELSRFASHLGQFGLALKSHEAAGRTLDFLCQELHREMNTIGSKANDAAISHLVVAAKTEVEKLREQVQNVE